MKIIKTINFLSIIFLIIVSCKPVNAKRNYEKTYPVIIEDYVQNIFRRSNATTLTVRKNDSVNLHLFDLKYQQGKETNSYETYSFFIKEDSRILKNNISAKFIEQKQYSDKFLIRKYYYNPKYISDANGFIYTMNEKVILFKSKSWNVYRVFKYENSEIYNFLKNDETDFIDI